MHRRYRHILVPAVMAAIAGCAAPPASEVGENTDDAKPAVASKPGEKDKNLPSVLERVAFKAMKSRNIQTAASLYRRVLELEPSRRSAQIGLADSLVYLGEHENAASIYRRVLASDPADAKTRGKLGRTLLSLNKPREAVGLIGQSMTSRNNIAGLNNLGVAYLLMGQPIKAQQYFRRANAHQPGNLSIRNNLAVTFALTGQSRNSVRLIGNVAGDTPPLQYVRQNLALFRAMERGRNADGARLALLSFGDEAFPFLVAAVDTGALGQAPGPGKSRMAATGLKTPQRFSSTPKTPSKGVGSITTVRQGRQLAQNNAVIGQPLETPQKAAPVVKDRAPSPPKPNRPRIRPAVSEPSAAAGNKISQTAAVGPGYRVQLGAFSNQRNARAAGQRITRAVPDLVKGFVLTQAESATGGTLFRLQTAGALQRSDAYALCKQLKARSIGCYVTPAPKG